MAKQTFILMTKYYRKKPVLTAAICIMPLWLTMVLYAALKIGILEKTFVKVKTSEINSNVGEARSDKNSDMVLRNLDIPLTREQSPAIDKFDNRRRRLLRSWINGTRLAQTTKRQFTEKEHISRPDNFKEKMVTNGSMFRKVDTTKTLNLDVKSTTNLNVASSLHEKDFDKKFKISAKEYKTIMVALRNFSRKKSYEANIPENLQKEIGPISNYTDKARLREEFDQKRRFIFRLPFWVVSKLLLEKRGEIGMHSVKDVTNQDNVKNEIGPISEYNKNEDIDEDENDGHFQATRNIVDWMKYFGQRINDNSDWII